MEILDNDEIAPEEPPGARGLNHETVRKVGHRLWDAFTERNVFLMTDSISWIFTLVALSICVLFQVLVNNGSVETEKS